MRKLLSSALSLMVAAAFCFGTPAGAFAQPPQPAEASFADLIAEEEAAHAEDQLIVTYDSGTSSKAIRRDVAKVGSVSEITKTQDQKVVLVDLAKDEVKAAEILDQAGKALSVQPNYRYEIAGEENSGEKTDDPFLNPDNTVTYQYYLRNTRAMEAWTFLEEECGRASDAEGTIVGVVDTGVDSRHEDLKANLLTKDNKGTYQGYQYGKAIDLNDDVSDHGTHVTGIIGAEYGNGRGGSGIASGHDNDLVRVITTAAEAPGGELFTYDICQAIDYTVGQGARVINMSFGGSGEDSMMENCIRQHYLEDGTVFVAASGNDGSNGYSSPCDYPTVIAVNASDAKEQATYWSDYGQLKDVSAPGNNIMSTYPGDNYEIMSGTSMASPAVAGICGLMLDANPDLSPAQVKNILCTTTKEAQAGKVFDDCLACGNVDALAAVRAAREASAQTSPQSLIIKENEGLQKAVAAAGSYMSLSALVRPAACQVPVVWESDDESVATVDETGRVTAVAEGQAVISASCGQVSDEIRITVKDASRPESIKIKEKKTDEEGNEIPLELELYGEGVMGGQFHPDVRPAGASFPFEFSSSDNDILFVDGPGYYTAVKAGTVTVSLWKGSSRQEADKLDEMTVVVKNPVTEVVFTKKTQQLDIGGTFSFEAKVTDEDPYHPQLTYSVSNGNGSIDPATGAFKALKEGSCYVVAKTEGDIYDSCKVIITKKNYAGADYRLKAKKARKKVTLTWKALPCAKAYQVQKQVKGGKWKTIKTVKKAKYVDKKFTKTSKYRVRAKYNKSGKTGWYGWSKVVKAKK